MEERVVELVAFAVPKVPISDALDAVTVWPVPDDAGLYLVGFDTGRKKFIYAGGSGPAVGGGVSPRRRDDPEVTRGKSR